VNQDRHAQSHRHGGLVAFDEKGDSSGEPGNPQTAKLAPSVWWGGPAIARVLPDSKSAQVVVANGVYDAATGKTLCRKRSSGGRRSDQRERRGHAQRHRGIDLDGVPEIVTGNNAYKLEKDATSH